MWSLVIAKDMFSAFSATGDIMKPETAMKYRRLVLAPTGAKSSAQLVQDFLGRPYGFKAYEAWLNAN
jgi:thimet oligopeptidase